MTLLHPDRCNARLATDLDEYGAGSRCPRARMPQADTCWLHAQVRALPATKVPEPDATQACTATTREGRRCRAYAKHHGLCVTHARLKRELSARFAPCPDCARTDPHIHCPECGSTEHVAESCDMLG